jgi:3-hydroxy acid dehydrogenase/malonic semialdehyde reductase
MVNHLVKWVLYIFAGICVLCISTLLIFSLIDRRVPVNESTKTCLVTGVSSGIGTELAREIIHRGWTVIGVARREEKLKDLAHELGNNFIPYVCDVSSFESVGRVSEDIKAKGLKPTLFFLNAGTSGREDMKKVSMAEHQKRFATNYFGVIAWVDVWLPLVKQWGGGTFVATSSIAALFSPSGAAAYGASKVALIHCFRTLQLQYLNDNIGFSVVLPGVVDTAMGAPVGKVPFVHRADDEARQIITSVFKGKKYVELSFFWSTFSRFMRLLPDQFTMKIFSGLMRLFCK